MFRDKVNGNVVLEHFDVLVAGYRLEKSSLDSLDFLTCKIRRMDDPADRMASFARKIQTLLPLSKFRPNVYQFPDPIRPLTHHDLNRFPPAEPGSC
jgi:hypothetical protein